MSGITVNVDDFLDDQEEDESDDAATSEEDITGRYYEAFTEFILRRLGYRDEWTPGDTGQYLYEQHREALCHRSASICPHAETCSLVSQQKGLKYGPWYDPDFFILEKNKPVACLHVTHWSNPGSSQYKFWRMIEDHFQFKTLFGHSFLSISLIYAALDGGQMPRLVVDTSTMLSINGWKPATGAIAVVSFDASILFPKRYEILDRFAKAVASVLPGNARLKRILFNTTWDQLYAQDAIVRQQTDAVVKLLGQALTGAPNPRYTPAAIQKLQDVCFNGREKAPVMMQTETRYRKGLQHAFLLRELIARQWGAIGDPDTSLWKVLTTNRKMSII